MIIVVSILDPIMVIEVAVVTLTINHKGQRYKTATINLQWSIDPFYSTVTV